MISDARLLGKLIGSVQQTHIRIGILLIERHARKARRERGLPLRRINRRRIGVAALPCRFIEGNVSQTLACGRSRKPLGNLHFARKIALMRRICRIAELLRERIERFAHEVLFRRSGGIRLQSDAVCRQRDAAARCRILDDEVAAQYLLRLILIVFIEYARMTAVVVNGDVLIVLLEDQTCMRSVAAAPQRGETAAFKRIVELSADAVSGFLRYITFVKIILPYRAVLQPEVDLPFAKRQPLQAGVLIHHGYIDAARFAHSADVACQIYGMAARCAARSVDEDLSRRTCEKRQRFPAIMSSYLQAFQGHCAGLCCYRIGESVAVAIDLRPAGNRRRPALIQDSPYISQLPMGNIRQHAKRTCFDGKILAVIFDGDGLSSGSHGRIRLDREHMIRCIDLQIRQWTNRAEILFLCILIGNQ